MNMKSPPPAWTFSYHLRLQRLQSMCQEAAFRESGASLSMPSRTAARAYMRGSQRSQEFGSSFDAAGRPIEEGVRMQDVFSHTRGTIRVELSRNLLDEY